MGPATDSHRRRVAPSAGGRRVAHVCGAKRGGSGVVSRSGCVQAVPLSGGAPRSGKGGVGKGAGAAPQHSPPPQRGRRPTTGAAQALLAASFVSWPTFPVHALPHNVSQSAPFPPGPVPGGGGAGPAGQPIGLRSVMAVPAPDTPRQRPTRKKPTGGPSRGGPSRPRVAVQASSVEILQIFMGQGADPVHKKTITRFPGPTALGREAGPAPANRRPPQWRL